MKPIFVFVFCGFATTTASMSSEYGRIDMEILEIIQTENSSGWTKFTGSVVNNGSRTIKYPQIIITLKFAGKVVEFDNGYIEGPSGNELAPGETGFFEIIFSTSRSGFDDHSISLMDAPMPLALNLSPVNFEFSKKPSIPMNF